MNIPAHIGIIMDGNRRWAKDHNLSVNKGHEEGAQTLRRIAHCAFSKGVKHLTVFAFSTENWQRATEEVGFLMKLFIKSFERYLQEFADKGIRVVILGSRDNLSPSLIKSINNAEEITKKNNKATIAVCLNYGGRQEIIDATKKLINKGLRAETITEKVFADELYGGQDIPDIDIMIRTSGEQRISNFMLWRSAYSELMFINKHWPDFDEADLDLVINEYARRQRRFGA